MRIIYSNPLDGLKTAVQCVVMLPDGRELHIGRSCTVPGVWQEGITPPAGTGEFVPCRFRVHGEIVVDHDAASRRLSVLVDDAVFELDDVDAPEVLLPDPDTTTLSFWSAL